MSWLAALAVVGAALFSVSSWRRRLGGTESRDTRLASDEAAGHDPQAREILAAHRRNQRRMSRELHDGVSQNLAGISLLLGSVAGQLGNPPASGIDETMLKAAADKLGRIAEMVQNTSRMAEDRVLAHRFQEEMPAENLRNALEILAKNIETFFAVDSRVVGELPRRTTGDHAGHLYRIAEEAAYNAVQHGRPSHVRFELRHDAGYATLHVDDDGCGMTEQRDPNGRGLQLMTLRCTKIDAELDVGPRDPHGTRVSCRWKLDDATDRGGP